MQASDRPSSLQPGSGSFEPAVNVATSGGDPPTIIRAGRGSGDPHSTPPQPGDHLEWFELLRSIGVGGMGAVYLANDGRLEREVALKILPPDQAADSESVQRFYQEARAAARLDHENIARVYSIGSDKGHHYIAFEYIEGVTLRQKIAGAGRLTVAEAVDYTLQVAAALAHSSSRGVVHRDVKPSNVIITPTGRAKLVDMGLARSFERGGGDNGLTQSGMTLGTFDYISPEQALDPRDVDVRGDLYSLGCTLFHMLAGRPPFPEGTALQKLRQHELEPPPDIHTLNPAVPVQLAALLTKLMAKDRERRHQTPDALIRDLMAIAASIGLRPSLTDGLAWPPPRIAPAWEKHLVWGVPATALAGVIGLLIWWGQPPMPQVAPVDPRDVAAITTTPHATVVAEPAKRVESPTSVTPAQPALRRSPREVILKAGDSLAAAIAREASGSTIILADDGPFALPPAPTAPITRRDLTIRAGPDAHPVLRPARVTSSGIEPTDPALLAFGTGNVVLEGIEFQLDGGEGRQAWAGVRSDGADVQLRRCSFRVPVGRLGFGTTPSSAVQIRSTNPDPDRRFLTSADACHFDGGLVAFWAKGPTEIQIRDCTFGADGPAFWFDNGGATELVNSELIARHISARLGSVPLIRATRTALRAVLEDSVVAVGVDGPPATLVETDEPERLAWRGKANLYSGIGTYLRASRDLMGKATIEGFEPWADDPHLDREALSAVQPAPVWESPELAFGSRRRDPSSAFALAIPDRPTAEVGARRGPRGRIVSLDEGLASLMGIEPTDPSRRPSTPSTIAVAPEVSVRPEADQQRIPFVPMPGPPDPDRRPQEDRVVQKEAIVPIGPQPMNRDEMPPITPVDRDPTPPVAVPVPEPEPARPADIATEPDMIRTAADFLAAADRLGPRGGTITLAADADLDLPAWQYEGSGRVVIRAEEGKSRPILRFRPAATAGIRPSRGLAFLTIQRGSVELSGVDILLEAAFAPGSGDWVAFRVAPRADLTLRRATVTVEGPKSRSTLVEIAIDRDQGDLPNESSLAEIRVTDSLLRGSGDVISLVPSGRVDAELTNVIVGAGGTLLHARGKPRSDQSESLRVVLRQVSARLAGGLAFLESSPGEPDLPQLDILARDVVVATDGDEAPLFRVDGQDGLEALRDRIKWDGQGVQYHRIEVYRRDQTARPGTVPQRFDRPSWDVAVAPREADPFHGDVHFLKPWDTSRSPATLTPEDVRLDPDGPSSIFGPDLKRVPPAPVLKK